MSIKGKAYIGGIFEHPARKVTDKSVAQMHAECAKGALEDAGLSIKDVDAYFCSNDAPGMGGSSMIDYMGLKVRHIEATNTGGSSFLYHVAHAAESIAANRCNVALITCSGFGRKGTSVRDLGDHVPDAPFENPFGPVTLNLYAMAARRHMYEYGTTSEQLAWVKVSASRHAQYNPNALIRKQITVEEVLASPMIADPLHRLDACVMTDSGGAVLVVKPEIAKSLKTPQIRLIGAGEAPKDQSGGRVDLTRSGAIWSGPMAFEEAGVTPADIKYASIYDSFTITVLITLEDLGFCERGTAGRYAAEGNLIAGIGKCPINTDGGGMCNNHPGNKGGITKIIEAVRQLRGQANPEVQVNNCDLALAHGTGGSLGTRHCSATLIFERV